MQRTYSYLSHKGSGPVKIKMRGKHKPLISAVLIALVLAAIVAAVVLARVGGEVRMGNGYTVQRSSYNLLRGRYEAEVLRYFYETYGAEDGPGFWTNDYAGETPQQIMDQKVMAQDARCRVLFALGQQHGLIDFGDMAGFHKALEQENQRRKTATAAGEPIYGPTTFTASDYLDYILSNLTLQLPSLMEGSELTVTEQGMQAFYQELFLHGVTVRLQLVELPLEGQEDAVAAIQGELAQGADFDSIMRRYNPGGELLNVEIKENSITHSRYPELYALAVQTQPGVTAGPYALSHGVVFFKCLDIIDAGMTPYQEALPKLREYVLQHELEQYIQNAAAVLLDAAVAP